MYFRGAKAQQERKHTLLTTKNIQLELRGEKIHHNDVHLASAVRNFNAVSLKY